MPTGQVFTTDKLQATASNEFYRPRRQQHSEVR